MEFNLTKNLNSQTEQTLGLSQRQLHGWDTGQLWWIRGVSVVNPRQCASTTVKMHKIDVNILNVFLLWYQQILRVTHMEENTRTQQGFQWSRCSTHNTQMSKRWKSLTSKISKLSQIQDYLCPCKSAWYHKYFHAIGLIWSNLPTNKLRLQLDGFELDTQIFQS